MRLTNRKALWLLCLSTIAATLSPTLGVQAQEQYLSIVTAKGAPTSDRVGTTTNTVDLLAGQTFMMVQASQAGFPKEGPQGLQPPVVQILIERDGKMFQVWRWIPEYNIFHEGLPTFALGAYSVVTGPGKLHFIGADTLFTYKVVPGPDNPLKTSIVLPGPENAMHVTMEVSTDLSNWMTTTNGLKSGEVAQFFRIRLEKPSRP